MEKSLKRLMDLGVALLGLVLLSPLYCAVALTIILIDGTPVLFRQIRPGLHGDPITVIKFRTMSRSRGLDGKLLPDSERLTRLGRFLRRMSLDELPQLWNVVKGELSLVGPRPLLMEYLPLYSPEQMRRHDVKPGITGWAQVNGRNAISWEEKFRLDLWYVDNWSLMLDLRILAITLRKLGRAEGITPGDSENVEFFRGTQKPRE